MFNKSPLSRKAARRGASVLAALGFALLLSGCVIEPIGPYYHPHHYYYGY